MIEGDNPKFSFMYRKISMSRMELSYWLSVPEFIEEISRMMASNITIDNRSVYEVASKIYDEKERMRSVGFRDEGFNYRIVRRGLNRILSSSEA